MPLPHIQPKKPKNYTSDNIEWFIEDQAFLRSYDSAPCPPPPNCSIPSASCLSFSIFLCITGRAVRLPAGGGGRTPKSYDSEKAWPSLNHSVLFLSTPLSSFLVSPLFVWQFVQGQRVMRGEATSDT
jgi:hypothetical protein